MWSPPGGANKNILCLIPKLTVTSPSAPKDTLCKTHPQIIIFSSQSGTQNAVCYTVLMLPMSCSFTHNCALHGEKYGSLFAQDGKTKWHPYALLFKIYIYVFYFQTNTQS